MEQVTREQMLQGAVNRIMGAPNSKVMIILEHEDGNIEFFHSSHCYSWLFGILKSTYLIIEEAYRERVKASTSQSFQEAKQEEFIRQVNKPEAKN